jgi:hypothetical protein
MLLSSTLLQPTDLVFSCALLFTFLQSKSIGAHFALEQKSRMKFILLEFLNREQNKNARRTKIDTAHNARDGEKVQASSIKHI